MAPAKTAHFENRNASVQFSTCVAEAEKRAVCSEPESISRHHRRRIGLLGGSFNPAHEGHRHISLEALKRLGLDEIWWLVSPQNPLKPSGGMADYDARLASARGVSQHPRIRVLDLEAQHSLFYTIDTVRFLQAHYPRLEFVWLMGADNLANFHRWRNWREIAARLPIAVLDRAPYGLKALRAPFALSSAARRVRQAAALWQEGQPRWMYLTIPRHPQSSTALRKSLGAAAFLRHTPRR